MNNLKTKLVFSLVIFVLFLYKVAFGATSDGIQTRTPLEDAIVQVESSGNPDAVGDNGLAIGIFQIHPIMVSEVNRILGEEKYLLEDRRDAAKSLEMFRIYSDFWCRKTNDFSGEGISRRWNGGPKGHLKESTVSYWKKVQKEMVVLR